MMDMKKFKKIVIWGGGLHTEFLYQVTSVFQAHSSQTFSIVDRDELKQGRTWRGIPIQSPNCLSGHEWGNTALLISSYGGQNAIALDALALNVPEDRIIKIYDMLRGRKVYPEKEKLKFK